MTSLLSPVVKETKQNSTLSSTRLAMVTPRPRPRSLLVPLLRPTPSSLPFLSPPSRSHSTLRDAPPPPVIEAKNGNYPGHAPINLFQRALLTVGSAVMGIVDTNRHGQSLPSSALSSTVVSGD